MPVEEFRDRHLLRSQPVIFSDLFRGQPLATLRTEADVRRALGDAPIELKFNYAEAELLAMTGKKAPPLTLRQPTVSSYLDFVQREPNTFYMSIEMQPPAALRALFNVPKYCIPGAGADETISLFFLGNQGNYASPHFDSDQRHVLLYQVFGRKRVILAPPAASRKLAPIAHFATQRISNFQEADKSAFASYLGGYEFMLNPGEAVYIPPLFWHYLEYTDTAMSFNIRFGRNRYNRALSGDFVHPNWRLQRLASEFIDTARVEREPTLGRIFATLQEELAKRHASPSARHEAIDLLCQRFHAELFPDEAVAHSLDGLDEIRLQAGRGFYASLAEHRASIRAR